MYDALVYSGYNFFTGMPPVVLGAVDRDVSAATLLKFPVLYGSGRLNANLNMRKMGEWILNAVVHALVVTLIPIYAVAGNGDSALTGRYSVGIVIYTCLIFTVTFKIGAETATWTKLTWGFWLFNFAFFFVFVCGYNALASYAPDFYWVFFAAAGEPAFWLLALLVPVVAMAADTLAEQCRLAFAATPADEAWQLDQLTLRAARKRAKRAAARKAAAAADVEAGLGGGRRGKYDRAPRPSGASEASEASQRGLVEKLRSAERRAGRRAAYRVGGAQLEELISDAGPVCKIFCTTLFFFRSSGAVLARLRRGSLIPAECSAVQLTGPACARTSASRTPACSRTATSASRTTASTTTWTSPRSASTSAARKASRTSCSGSTWPPRRRRPRARRGAAAR